MSWRGSGNFGPFRLHFLPGRGRVQTSDLRRLVREFCDVIWTVSTTAGRVFLRHPCCFEASLPSPVARRRLPSSGAVFRRPTPSPDPSCCFGRCRVPLFCCLLLSRRPVAEFDKVCVCQSVSGKV